MEERHEIRHHRRGHGSARSTPATSPRAPTARLRLSRRRRRWPPPTSLGRGRPAPRVATSRRDASACRRTSTPSRSARRPTRTPISSSAPRAPRKRSSARSRSTSTSPASAPASKSSSRPGATLMAQSPASIRISRRCASGSRRERSARSKSSRSPHATRRLRRYLAIAAARRPVPRNHDPRFRHGSVRSRREARCGERDGVGIVDKAIGEAGDIDTPLVIIEIKKSGKVAQISNSRRATYGYDQRDRGARRQGHAQCRQCARRPSSRPAHRASPPGRNC